MARRFEWTKARIERLVWMTLDGEPLAAIAAKLGCEDRTARKMQWELELCTRRDVHRWTRKERATLRKMYATRRTAEIAELLGLPAGKIWQQAKKLGLRKDVSVIAEMARERSARPDHGGAAFRYPKGHVPANKGLRRPGWAPGRMAETQFRKGERSGFAERNWKPVGSIVADPEGFLRIKIAERVNGQPPGWDKSIWPLLHHYVWERAHGSVPPGHKLRFKDGDRNNCALENLELLTNAEMLRRNSIYRYPPEMVAAMKMLGAVKRRVRENAEKHIDGSAQPSV